ncbi:MAG: histidinol-phosphate transaminase [Candidatus Acidiferrales bacterium]
MKLPIEPRRAVMKMRPYHPPLEGRGGKVRLDFNENTLGCAPAVRRALRKLTANQVAIYPEYQAVRHKLARYFGVRPAELLLTTGTDDALRLIVDTFIEPGRRVLLAEPTFAMYRFYAERAGARILTLRHGPKMQFPLAEVLAKMRARVSRPDLFFLANPNNPTGTLVPLEDLGRMLDAARKTLVVIDEAYFDYCGVTALPWIRRYTNLIVTRTFSKAAGMAGLRIGCVFARAKIAAELQKAHSPYPVSVAALVAAEAMTHDRAFLRLSVREALRSRREMENAFVRLGIPFFASAANFVLADFGARGPEILAKLRRENILVRDRRADFDRAGYIRITTGARSETGKLLRAIERIW